MRRLMRRVLVAGAGGGIGAALVDVLASRPDVDHVYALHRRPVSSVSSNVTWLTAEPARACELTAAADRIAEDGGLDGIIITTGALHAPGGRPEKSLREIDAQKLHQAYEANAIVPLLILNAFRPLLADAEAPFAAVLSAQVGSIGDNRLGGWYGYRMAKAALNMAVKTAAIELGRERNPPTVVALHPGTTRTALSERFVRRRKQPVATPQEAADRLLAVLAELDPEQSGAFLNYDGLRLPW